MAPKGMKRSAASATGMNKKPAKAFSLSKQCASISHAILGAEALPEVVRSMLARKVEEAFGTYKEERHPYQNTISEMVGEVLGTVETGLQKAIGEAEQKKRALEEEHAPVLGESNEARAASEAAAKVAEEKKGALADSKAALNNAAAALDAATADLENAEANIRAPAAKKEIAERLTNSLPSIKEGSAEAASIKKSVSDVKYLAQHFDLEESFVAYVVKTLKADGWRTFEKIVVQEFEDELAKIVARLGAEIDAAAPIKTEKAAALESATKAVSEAEEAVKAATEASAGANAAAAEAAAAAKAAAAKAKPEIAAIDKAAKACTAAENELAAFKSGVLAAYVEVEARAKPSDPVAVDAEGAGAPLAPAVEAPAVEAPAVEAAASA